MTTGDAVARLAEEFQCDVRDIMALLTAFLVQNDRGERQWVNLAHGLIGGYTGEVRVSVKHGGTPVVRVDCDLAVARKAFGSTCS